MELCLRNMTLKPSSTTDVSDELAIIERCRKNDAEAFGKIVDAYQNRLFGFVRRMVKDSEDASDIAQETFVRAFQGIHRFDGRSSIRTWLFRIAYNLCIDRARKVGRSPNESSLETTFEDDERIDVPDSRWDPQNVILGEELRTVLEGAIQTMSEKLRSVLLLHDQQDLAYEEIAKILNLPIGTVKSRLFLARAHLQNVVGAYLRGEANVS
jgi:RNA polymerase sigma-70 factor (ECF subfamily)